MKVSLINNSEELADYLDYAGSIGFLCECDNRRVLILFGDHFEKFRVTGNHRRHRFGTSDGHLRTMSALLIPWDSYHQLVIAEPGPWIAKPVTGGLFAYCPICHFFPQTKLGPEEQGPISCPCHTATAELVELEPIAERDLEDLIDDQA
jgi:hypothetical protein